MPFCVSDAELPGMCKQREQWRAGATERGGSSCWSFRTGRVKEGVQGRISMQGEGKGGGGVSLGSKGQAWSWQDAIHEDTPN